MPAFLKLRSKGVFLLFYLLAGICLLAARPAEAAESRIEKLVDEQAGPVCISGDWIVFSQQSEKHRRPAYYNIANGAKAVINPDVLLDNQDPVKISRGVALYRGKNYNKLYITNLETEQHWGLAKGQSKVIADKTISAYFAISSDSIAFLEGDGSKKNCWLVRESGAAVKIAADIRACDLQLYQDENYAFLSWKDKDSGILYYCNFNEDLSIKTLTASKSEGKYILWKNQVLYRNSGKFYLHSLAPGSNRQEISLPGAAGPVCLRDKDIFYAAGNSIKHCDLEKGSIEEIIQHEKTILNLDSNGSDIVWHDILYAPYWRAAVKELSLSGQKNLKLGENLQLGIQGSFKNNYHTDVTQSATWISSNDSIATVEKGFCTSKAPGSVTIRAVYEKIYAETSFNIKALTSLEISPATGQLKPGDTLQLHAEGVYSDASREDMTSIVKWECPASGSISGQGLFTAGEAGVAAIKASYNLVLATAQLTVAAVEAGQPANGEQDNGEKIDHPGGNQDTPNNPPIPEPQDPSPNVPPVKEPDSNNPPGNQPQKPVHRHSEDESQYLTNPPAPDNSLILRALKNAPQFSMVEVAIDTAVTDSLDFTLESAAMEIMNQEHKTLRIKSALGVMELSPAFAASYFKEDLKFKLKRGTGNTTPRKYGNCELNTLSASYIFSVRNERGPAINSFAAPIEIILFSNTGKKPDQEKSGVLGNKNPEGEWKYIRSKAAGDDGRKFACQFPGNFELMEFNCSFNDISSHWARSDIEIMAAQQLMEDSGDRSFIPEGIINRGEFAALLARVLDFNITAASTGSENKESEHKNPAYLDAAVRAGIIKGDLQNDLALQRGISREEMAVMISRALVTQNIAVEAYSKPEAFIGDWDAVSSWARKEVEITNNLGILQGRPDNSFAPRQPGTRAEAAAVMRRLNDYLR